MKKLNISQTKCKVINKKRGAKIKFLAPLNVKLLQPT